MGAVPFWWGGMAAFASAFFFILGFFLQLLWASGAATTEPSPWPMQNPGGDTHAAYTRFVGMDVEFIKQMWRYRASLANLEIAADLVLAIAFFLQVGAVAALGDLFEKQLGGHKGGKAMLLPSFVFCAVLVVLELTFSAGTATTTAWLAREWIEREHEMTVTDDMWRSLEISNLLSESRGIWTFAMEWFFLATGMCSAAYLNKKAGTFGTLFTVLSLVIVFMCIFGFTAEVARLRFWMVATQINIAVAVLVGLLMLPVWLVWLGFKLKAMPAQEASDRFQAAFDGQHSANEVHHSPAGQGNELSHL